MNTLRHKATFSNKPGALLPAADGADAASPQASIAGNLYKVFVGVGLMGVSGLYLGAAQAAVASSSLPVGGVVAVAAATPGTTDNAGGTRRGSFVPGPAASVSITQPNSSAALPARVSGDASGPVMGSTTADGPVALVSPGKVVIGKDDPMTSTSVGAGTLGVSEADFKAGNYHFSGGSMAPGAVNPGAIIGNNGYVVLPGASLTSEGKIVARGGDVARPTGQNASIAIPVSRTGRIRMVIKAADINTALTNNAGSLVQTASGQVLIQASSLSDALANIQRRGIGDTTATRGGDASSSINATATVDSAATPAAGSTATGQAANTGGTSLLAAHARVTGASLQNAGGFVKTSADTLNFDSIRFPRDL